MSPRRPSLPPRHEQFEKQPRDGAWATKAEATVRSAVRQSGLSSDKLTVSCRTSLCEARLHGAKVSGFQAMRALHANLGDDLVCVEAQQDHPPRRPGVKAVKSPLVLYMAKRAQDPEE